MALLRYLMLAGLATLPLMACSGDQPQEPESRASAGQAPDADHVWKEQVQTIDKARQAEEAVKKADEDRRKAIRDAGGG